MFNLYFFGLATVLFFVLTPGILVTIPKNNKYAAALVHALLFGTILTFTYKLFLEAVEGFNPEEAARLAAMSAAHSMRQ